MRIGIVCPYSFDAPGGVQFHIRDLASVLIAWGHEVSVLAPAEEGTPLPEFVVPAGRTVAVPYNGSVARLNFGLVASAKVARWLAEADPEILHIHEPITPSLGMLALWQSKVPTVGTFHSAQDRSRVLQFVSPVVQPMLEKLDARIAVSDEARRTVADHLGGDAFVIPNGVFVDHFRGVAPNPAWSGRRHGGPPTVAFLGRLDEPRKGLDVYAGAIPAVLERLPEARFLVAGRGDAGQVRAQLAPYSANVEFLGGISDEDKAALFASADIYVAPQTGGESFGIVLVEAMSGGALVAASDIPAFRAVTDDGAAGALFAVGDPADLARVLVQALDDGATTVLDHAAEWVQQYDWGTVARQVLAVYRTVLANTGVELPAAPPRLSRRLFRGGGRWSR